MRVAVADPDLQIREGGGGGDHPYPEIRTGWSKFFFRPFGPQFGLKIRGGPLPCRNPNCFQIFFKMYAMQMAFH